MGCRGGIMTLSIKGKVTLNSSNVENAKVRLIRESIDSTDNSYIGETTTNSSGEYEFTGLSETENYFYHVVVEYESGGTKYYAKSKPFLKAGSE